MATTPLFGYDPALIDAPVAEYPIQGGGGTGREFISFLVKMKTVTPESLPGFGTLLLTIKYWDGETLQSLNTSLNLSAGNATIAPASFMNLWWDKSGPDTTLELSYIGPGGTDGSADVTIDYVDH